MSQKRLPLPQSVQAPYTGGHTVKYGGYIFELCPDHPKANPFGFVPQHRLVVEREQGFFLLSAEHVHHKDERKANNNLDNLQVLSRSEHMKLHRQMTRESKTGPLVRDAVRQALQQGGLKKAAAALGVHTETIRNLYPDLVAPYKRRAPTRIDDPEAIAKVLAVAPNDKKSYKDVTAETGISYRTVQRICERNGIPWTPKTVENRPGRPPSSSKILNNDRMVERVRELAPNPQYGLKEIASELGISGPSVSAILAYHQIPWVTKSKGGYKHKNRRPPEVRSDRQLIERVRQLAADPTCGTQRAVRDLGVCARTIRNICEDQGFPWLSTRPGRPRGKTSNQKSSEPYGSQNGSASRRRDQDHPELSF